MAVSTPAPRRVRVAAAATQGRSGALLGLALVLACLYAAFASGATRFPQETRLQVGLALVALAATAVWATSGAIALRASRAALWGAGGLVAFAGWSGLTLLWSVTPDRTWLECNRAIAYALVVILGIATGSSDPRAVAHVARSWLAASTLVALYAFGVKALPGVDVPGLLDLDQASVVARLRAPLGYWNALALVCALGLPIALRIACDRESGLRARLSALAAGELLLCVIAMTYSRGGVIAIAAALVVLTLLGSARLRGLGTLALLAACATPVLGVAFSRTGLTQNAAPLGLRITDGRVLLGTFVVMLAVLLAIGLAWLRVEGRVRWTAGRTRTVFRLAGIAAAAGLLLAVLGLSLSTRGLPGQVADAASSFTRPKLDREFDPVRLASTNSGNRWIWWKEAVGAFSDRPVGGWGAGSFPATHLRYRQDDVPVSQPHSVPLQFLAETGLVGLLLAGGALVALGWAAVARVRVLPRGRERDLAVALLAAAGAWAAHGLYDWDWDIPGVTLPALLLAGVLCGRYAPPDAARPVLFGLAYEETRAGTAGVRAAGSAGAAVVLSLVAISAILPSWSAGKATAAQEAVAETSTDAQLQAAAAQASLAGRLDPLATDPLYASAAIAERRGRLLDARRFLLDAVRRQPESSDAWAHLAGLAFLLADRPGALRASQRALALDPFNPATRALALQALTFATPAGDSATAVGTPLAASGVVASAAAAGAAPAAAPVASPAPASGATGPAGALPPPGG